MLLWTIIKTSWRSLATHKLRTFLAMLGIIIGVGSVISMLAVATGAREQVMSQVNKMGTNLIVVRPGQSGTGGVLTGTRKTLMPRDAFALVREVPGIRMAAPVVSGAVQLKRLNRNSRTVVIGTSVTYLPVRSFEVDRGRAFTEDEAEKRARVALLGPVAAENLFGVEDPVGQVVRFNGIGFRVVGVLKSKGDLGFFSLDNLAIVPYTTAMTQLFGQIYVQEINIQTDADVDLKALESQMAARLRRNHRLPPGAPDDFEIRSQTESLEMLDKVAWVFTVLLGSIGGISLLVGGIGIMNIMLVTVTERTREIGVRKAIGARDQDILGQFLLESVLLTLFGGMFGVALGYLFARTVSAVSEFEVGINASSVAIALGFSVSVGVFFGLYPARRAAALDPIEALRFE